MKSNLDKYNFNKKFINSGNSTIYFMQLYMQNKLVNKNPHTYNRDSYSIKNACHPCNFMAHHSLKICCYLNVHMSTDCRSYEWATHTIFQFVICKTDNE